MFTNKKMKILFKDNNDKILKYCIHCISSIVFKITPIKVLTALLVNGIFKQYSS